MNPIQIVKAHCDCYQPNGYCLGITCNDQLKPVRFQKANSPCLLAFTPMKRCQHFESSIMPYKPDHKDARAAARLQAEFSDGVHEYRIRTGAMDASNIRLCPKCKTNKIGKGRKLCDQCKAENRRQTKSNFDHTQPPPG